MTLDVSVTRSGPADPEFHYMQCANFSFLNESVDGKLIMSVGYAHTIYVIVTDLLVCDTLILQIHQYSIGH